MDICFYKLLPTEVQIDYVLQYGINTGLVTFRKGSDVLLFALGDFYVEVSVEPYGDAITGLKAFASLKRLDPYLAQIDLKEIYGILSGS